MPKKYCNFPGCGEVIQGKVYCDKHKKILNQKYDKHRETAVKRGYGTRWRKFRATYLADHPFCEKCIEQNRLVEATEIHHLISLQNGGEQFDENNCQALCKMHHSQITMTENHKK